MTAWWDGLPVGSVVFDGVNAFVKHAVDWGCRPISGDYWCSGDWYERAEDIKGDITILHVPVTDTEPPPGSIVMAGPESYWEHARPQNLRPWADPWDLGSQRKSWADLRPIVTRILRWGPA